MLRLTLRERHTGQLLARIVERDGVLFVLDFGDPTIVSDAARRVLHGGFTVDWQGARETAVPNSPTLLRQLAQHYAVQGMLVFAEEPDYPRTAAPLQPMSLSTGPPTLLPDDPWDLDGSTVLRSRRELLELQDRIDTTVKIGPQLPSGGVRVDETLPEEDERG